MPRQTYTETGAQAAIIINPEHQSSYMVSADEGTPVFTVQVRVTPGGAWGVPSDTMGTNLNQAYTVLKPVSELRINISSLSTATEVYLDHISAK